tara:strand:- start:446 stop:1078 length:633 start_codon:yes stop_codon:yes gene_type:complete
MANVDDLLGNEEAIFMPSEENKNTQRPTFTPIVEGYYLGHITSSESRVVNVMGGKHKARVFNYKFTVSPDNKVNDYKFKWNNTEFDAKGDAYTDKIFNGAIFKYLEPQEGDTFTSRADGNVGYYKACERLGLKSKEETRKIDGKDVKVQILPKLTDETLIGKPLKVFVKQGKPWTGSDGKERKSWKVVNFEAWDGPVLSANSNDAVDVPF